MNPAVTRLLSSCLVLLLLAPGSSARPPGPQGPEQGSTAPDGRPGFGTKRTARQYAKLFQAPTEEQEEFLRGLHGISSEVLVLREKARRLYGKRGYFETLGHELTPSLADLHEKFREKLRDPLALLSAGGKEAQLFVAMWLDVRFRLRIELLELVEQEGQELRRGLALFGGTQNGFYDLKDSEARSIAYRLDIAAARLRAVRSDLEILKERGDTVQAGAADPAWGEELLGLAQVTDDTLREEILARNRARLQSALSRLESVLFSPRLAPRLKAELSRRQAALGQAAVHLERAQHYLMVPPFDQDPAPELLEMSRAERHRFALSEGLRGLDLDPMDEELTYVTASAAAELQAPLQTRPWFDRYLALRGIRSDDHGTIRGRELTPKEKRCLEEVMREFTTPGAGFGRR